MGSGHRFSHWSVEMEETGDSTELDLSQRTSASDTRNLGFHMTVPEGWDSRDLSPILWSLSAWGWPLHWKLHLHYLQTSLAQQLCLLSGWPETLWRSSCWATEGWHQQGATTNLNTNMGKWKSIWTLATGLLFGMALHFLLDPCLLPQMPPPLNSYEISH